MSHNQIQFILLAKHIVCMENKYLDNSKIADIREYIKVIHHINRLSDNII